MSTFKMIEKLGLSITTWGGDPRTSAVLAQELETLLQSAQVVYGFKDAPHFNGWNSMNRFPNKNPTHQAILLGIEPYKKKTKAEAALEFVKKISLADVSCSEPYVDEAKRILEMKDEV